MSRLDALKAKRAQLDALIADGTLTGEAARAARDRLEAEILGLVLQPASAPDAGPRPSGRLLGGVAAFVLAVGLAGYAWLGNPAALAVAPGSSAAVPQGAGHDGSQAEFEALTARLAERLKAQPDDAAGWSMLGRSYTVLERYPEALAAYQTLLKLRPQDAQALADTADAMGLAQGRQLAGEPEALVNRALAIDPDNPKALGLAGTIAFDRNDPSTAARLWERALRLAEPGSEMASRLQGAVNEARQAAGLPPLASPPPVAAASAASSVQLRVSLAPALAAHAAPEDTVFIFARAAQGSRMPLAIQRKQVKDLPLEITLDDSMAMNPATRLSTATQVVVGARVSKSGNAMPQPGDLQGLSAPVALGTRGLQLLIGERLP